MRNTLAQRILYGLTVGCVWWVTSVSASAEDADMNDESAESGSSLNTELQTLKEQVLEINRDLFILEEDLLFPASTQVSIFLSIDTGVLFDLDAVQLTIDGNKKISYLYTRREIDALKRGAVQRLYVDNIANGEHELVATFIGLGPDKREYKRATSLKFEKQTAAKMLELRIVDDEAKMQPTFDVKEWQ